MWISSTGLVCATGYSAQSACAAMRAGIAAGAALPYLGNDGEPIIGAAVDALPLDGAPDDRLLAMLCRAVVDCVARADGIEPDKTPLLLALPRPDRPGPHTVIDADRVAAGIETQLGWTFDRSRSRAFTDGAVAPPRALEAALDVTRRDELEGCLICGVDSFLSARTLLWLEKNRRLKTRQRSDGIIPGEAAGCVWLTRSRRLPRAARVLSVGFAKEPATVLDDEPFRGEGLARAARAALDAAGLTMADIDYRISDAGGESYAFREQSLLVSRLLRARKEAFPLWHPAEFIGATDASAGLVQLAVIDDALRAGYAPGPRALGCCSEPTGERAAVVIEGDVAVPATIDTVPPPSIAL